MKKFWAVGAFLIVTAGGAVFAPPVEARCPPIPEAGLWVNAVPQDNGIARIEIEHHCNDVLELGKSAPRGPAWKLEVVESVARFPHYWGWVGAESVAARVKISRRLNNPNGTAAIFATYARPSSRKYLYIGLSDQEDGVLTVVVYTDYADIRQVDTEERYRFLRPPRYPPGPGFRVD